MHNTVLEDRITGEVTAEFDTCYECLMAGCSFTPITEQITIEALDTSEQPLADQMAKMVNYLTQSHDIYDQEVMVPFRPQYNPPPRNMEWDMNYWRKILSQYQAANPPPKLLTYKKLVDS